MGKIKPQNEYPLIKRSDPKEMIYNKNRSNITLYSYHEPDREFGVGYSVSPLKRDYVTINGVSFIYEYYSIHSCTSYYHGVVDVTDYKDGRKQSVGIAVMFDNEQYIRNIIGKHIMEEDLYNMLQKKVHHLNRCVIHGLTKMNDGLMLDTTTFEHAAFGAPLKDQMIIANEIARRLSSIKNEYYTMILSAYMRSDEVALYIDSFNKKCVW